MSESDFFGDDGSGDEFWGQLGHEEGAAETEAPAAEAAVDEPAARARDESGRFVAAASEETPSEPEPEHEEATDGAEAAPTDPASLQAELETLKKRLADKDEHIGRQGNELGELRRLTEQIAEAQARPQVSDWDMLIDDDPKRAAEIALRAGDHYRYQQAKSAWNDLAPGAPDIWEQNLALERKYAELEQRFAPVATAQTEQAQAAQLANAYTQVAAKHPDFEQFEDAMQQVIETRPLLRDSLQKALAQGDVAAQAAALEDLYLITAGRKSDTLREAQNEVNQTLAATTHAAKQEAVLASTTSHVEEPVAPKNWWDVAAADEDARNAGWQIS